MKEIEKEKREVNLKIFIHLKILAELFFRIGGAIVGFGVLGVVLAIIAAAFSASYRPIETWERLPEAVSLFFSIWFS